MLRSSFASFVSMGKIAKRLASESRERIVGQAEREPVAVNPRATAAGK